MYRAADGKGPERAPAESPAKDPQRRIDCAPRRGSDPPDPQTSRGRGTPDRPPLETGREPDRG